MSGSGQPGPILCACSRHSRQCQRSLCLPTAESGSHQPEGLPFLKEGKSGYLLLVRGRKLLEIQHSSAWCKQPAACTLNAVFPANEAPALVTERSLITVPFLLVVWVPVPHLASYLKQRTRCQDLCLSKLSRDRRRALHAIALLRAAEEPCAEASRARPSRLQRLTFRWFCHTARYTS